MKIIFVKKQNKFAIKKKIDYFYITIKQLIIQT